MDVDRATYYFCDLKTNDIECPKMHECKRYEMVKDIPYSEYGVLGFANYITCAMQKITINCS